MKKPLLTSSLAFLIVACAQPPPAEPPASTRQPEADRAAVARLQAHGEMHQARREAADASGQAQLQPSVVAGAPAASPDPLGPGRYAPFIQNRENYRAFEDAGVVRVAERPVSTFSIDVDTGSYANVRRMLRSGMLPPQDAVRVEEMLNYFDYAYAPPADRAQPFAVHTELVTNPWNAKTHLLRVGLQGWKPQGELPASNLVFLVDVSGSMSDADKLPLVVESLKLLARELSARDRISLVVYAGASGVVLAPTPGDRKAEIVAALERLRSGGSTNGGDGIRLAYAMAQQGFIPGGINRVLLATDGDFNVGTVSFEQLKDLVEERRKSGVALSTLGFGTGNYNDHLMEQLADAGNGNYAYVDSLSEARRVLVESRAATLQTIARDVKIQVEFNPAVVSEYRLIGYENRALAREDFDNDAVDAGEIGAGHSVTALYEVALRGSGGERVAPLRYQGGDGKIDGSGEVAFLRLRYQRPEGSKSQLLELPLASRVTRIEQASAATRWAAAVAGFGQLLRGGRYTGSFAYADVLALARSAGGNERDGWKSEFLQLVELGRGLSTTASAKAAEIAD